MALKVFGFSPFPGSAVISGLAYKGAWNATTNTPTLADGTGTTGDTYAVSVGGTQFTRTFVAGGWAIYNGTIWQPIGAIAFDANNLSGTTLKSTIINSSLTSVGTLAGLTVTATIAGSINGTAAIATATTITNDTTTAATMYPTWVTASTGNLPQKTSSTKLSFVPSTGILTASGFAGPLTGAVTGNADTATTAATVTTAAQ